MGLQHQTTGHLNIRLLERRTTKIPTPQPNQTTSLAAPVDITKSRVHSDPTGAPHRRLPITKPILIQQCPTIIGNILVLFTRSQTDNDSHTKHHCIWTIENNPREREKVVQLINYVATHLEATTHYHAIGITLHMHINTSFTSVPGA